jgi:hypothetical protein
MKMNKNNLSAVRWTNIIPCSSSIWPLIQPLVNPINWHIMGRVLRFCVIQAVCFYSAAESAEGIPQAHMVICIKSEDLKVRPVALVPDEIAAQQSQSHLILAPKTRY